MSGFEELCDINCAKYYQIIKFYCDDGLFEWLKSKKLIAQSRQCEKCASDMRLQKKLSIQDKKNLAMSKHSKY